jgi:hypothetical protein
MNCCNRGYKFCLIFWSQTRLNLARISTYRHNKFAVLRTGNPHSAIFHAWCLFLGNNLVLPRVIDGRVTANSPVLQKFSGKLITSVRLAARGRVWLQSDGTKRKRANVCSNNLEIFLLQVTLEHALKFGNWVAKHCVY